MLVIIIVSIIFTMIICLLYMKYLKMKKRKYAKECVNWSCNQVGQICKPDSPGADNKTWICDGATWHQTVNPDHIKNNKKKYVKACNDWSCNQPGQLCPPNASGAEGRLWICDGETWHQAVKPYY